MRFVAIIEARMTSSRLPGKVLMEVLGVSMLERLLIRLQSILNLDEIIVATTINIDDDPIVEIANKLGVMHFRGSEFDVLARVVGAGVASNAEVVVEITADCPIIDPRIIEQMIEIYKINECDYLSNCHFREFPDGMDVQLINFRSLQESHSLELTQQDREHVSLFIRNHPEFYRQIHIAAPKNLRYPKLRLTLDDEKDLRFIAMIISHFEPGNVLFGCGEILEFLGKEFLKESFELDARL
jgi:spore coat polysaccharide biosynthesis protein SpsF